MYELDLSEEEKEILARLRTRPDLMEKVYAYITQHEESLQSPCAYPLTPPDKQA